MEMEQIEKQKWSGCACDGDAAGGGGGGDGEESACWLYRSHLQQKQSPALSHGLIWSSVLEDYRRSGAPYLQDWSSRFTGARSYQDMMRPFHISLQLLLLIDRSALMQLWHRCVSYHDNETFRSSKVHLLQIVVNF